MHIFNVKVSELTVKGVQVKQQLEKTFIYKNRRLCRKHLNTKLPVFTVKHRKDKRHDSNIHHQ